MSTESVSTGSVSTESLTSTAPRFHLATWKLHLDHGVMQRGDLDLAATAPRAVAKLSAANADRFGAEVAITGDRGTVTLPVEVADLADNVVWVPSNSFGRGVLADLASPGSTVEVRSA